MSKSSAKRRKNRSAQSSRSSQPAKSSSSAQAAHAAQPAKKVHGAFLTGVLVFLVLHAILTAVLLIAYRKDPDIRHIQPWVWAAAAFVPLAEIAGVAAIWFWKRWGLYLYLVATVVGIVFGFLLYPSQLVAFHGIIPIAILGYTLAAQKKMQLLT
jgi:hypothetical protein